MSFSNIKQSNAFQMEWLILTCHIYFDDMRKFNTFKKMITEQCKVYVLTRILQIHFLLL